VGRLALLLALAVLAELTPERIAPAGDTAAPFAHLGKSLNLPQTAILSLKAPERIPLLEEEAYAWWDSFDEMGERASRFLLALALPLCPRR